MPCPDRWTNTRYDDGGVEVSSLSSPAAAGDGERGRKSFFRPSPFNARSLRGSTCTNCHYSHAFYIMPLRPSSRAIAFLEGLGWLT